MDENVNVEEKIRALVKEFDIDYDSLKPKIKSHLINIETYLSSEEDVLNKLNADLKKAKVTSSSIAQESGIKSRQTLYNNPILKQYSEHRMEQVNSLNPYSRFEDLKMKIDSLNEQVDKMATRDIDTEILRNQVELLTETIKNRDSSVIALEEQNKAMRDKIHELKKLLPPTVDTSIPETKIVPFKR